MPTCPCCGDNLDERQIYRHLGEFDHHFDLAIGDISMDSAPGADGDSDTDDDVGSASDSAGDSAGDSASESGSGSGLSDDLGAGDDVVLVDDPGAAGEDMRYEHDLEPAQAHNNMDLGNADPVLHLLDPIRQLRLNPAVAIEDWDELPELEESDFGDESIDGEVDGEDRDPEYAERMAPLGFDPDDEPGFTDDELLAVLEARLGDMAEEEWLDMYSRILSKRDRKTLDLLATRLRTHFSRRTWDDLRYGICEEFEVPSEFVAWRRLRILSGLETVSYDCCINSCICFLGKYKDLDRCPFCRENRYTTGGKARRYFHYTPVIPQLRGLFQSASMATKLRYRVEAEQAYEPGVIQDVFDGENYRKLRETELHPGGGYRFFDNPEDIAIGFSTDGLSLFKRRRRGYSTAWPLILIIYNLHPKIRTRLENVICAGVIPGPKQCKDMNSFLAPLLEEFLRLENGVEFTGLTPTGEGYNFVFHAFIIIVFGDIPALTKVLCMKGHNAIAPCRACYIQGVLCQLAKSSVYYVPMRRPDQLAPFPFDQLIMRTKPLFLRHLTDIEAPQTEVARDQLKRDVGINGRSIFLHLKSVDLPSSFPYDLMHLLFENLVPNMVRHWTGKFKGMSQGTGSYQLTEAQWNAVGRLTAQATKTIPAAFVGTLPDIAQDFTLFKAEAFSFWFQYLAPILLADLLPRRYYEHFLLIREITIRCLKFKITAPEIDELQRMINQWVTQYEEYYYQHRTSRLPTCPLTIHALLHIPYFLRRTGPLWASWAFIMERFCGSLLPAVKNRVRPYEHLDNYVQRRAQMQIVSKVHNLPSLSRPTINYKYINGVEMSSRETMYPEFPDIILGVPVNRHVQLNAQLTNQFTKYFGVIYGLTGPQLQQRIDKDSLVRYGRFRIAGDGDKIRTATAVNNNQIARDNSYIKYDLLPDRNAARPNQPDVPYRRTQYGQLQDIYYVRFIEDDGTHKPYLLARVRECKTDGRDAALPENPVVTYTRMSTPDIIHVRTIVAVIGRVQMGNSWAIVDRSRDSARTQFVDEEGNEEYD